MKNKFLKVSLPCVIALPIITTSCVDYSKQNELNKLIDSSDAIVSVSDDNKLKTHKSILNTLLNNAFRSDSLKIQEYINLQTSKTNYDNLVASYKTISENFKLADDKKSFAQSLNAFYSQNWYFILNNLDKFDFNFIEFVTVDLAKNYATSQEYQDLMVTKTNQLKNSKQRKSWEFENSYLDGIREGVESTELGDVVVYYVRKNKLIFRIVINNLRAQNTQPIVQLRPINWYFSESKANTISPSLISNVVHQLFIHGYERGKEEFEVEMVQKQKYGSPSFVFATWKDKSV